MYETLIGILHGYEINLMIVQMPFALNFIINNQTAFLYSEAVLLE